MESILLVHLWKFMTLSCCILLRMRNDSDKSCRENQNTYYEGRLISNAHSEIFCQRSTVAMHAQCVLVATTLLHSGAKFHSFLYTGSKTVRVNVESCYGGMSTRVKQRAVTEFLSAENVMTAEIHHRLQAVYGENTVNRTTVNRWAINFVNVNQVVPILLTNLTVEGRFPWQMTSIKNRLMNWSSMTAVSPRSR